MLSSFYQKASVIYEGHLHIFQIKENSAFLITIQHGSSLDTFSGINDISNSMPHYLIVFELFSYYQGDIVNNMRFEHGHGLDVQEVHFFK